MISKIEQTLNNNENEINLKTNLNDSSSVYHRIRKVKFSNFNEIFNGFDISNKNKKFSYSSKNGFHKMLSNKSNKNNNSINKNSFVTEINQKSFENKTGEGNLSVPINKNKIMENLSVFIENFYEYFEHIRSFYPIFKRNHSNFNINNNNIIITNEYKSNFNNKLKKFINENKKDFIDSKDFKLDFELLNLNLTKISNKIIPIQDEKIQIIEEEKKYCLNYFKNVVDYIKNNLYLNNEIHYLINIINKNKFHMKIIRNNYIKNSAQILLKKNKKQNLLKIKNYLLNIHKITKNINNIFNCDINEEKQIVKNIQKNFLEFKKNNKIKNKKIKILYQIEKDIIKFSQDFEVKYINTFITKLYKILISCYNFIPIKSIFSENNLTSKFNSNIIYDLNDEYSFKNTKDYFYQSKYKIYNLSNNEKLENEINILLNLYNIILFNSYDFNLLIDKIKSLISFIISEIQDIKINNNENKNDNYIYILIIINSFYYLYFNFNFIIDCITNNFGTSKKTFNEINSEIIINKCENFLLNLIDDYINIELVKNNNFEIFFNIEGSLLNELNKFGKILNKKYNNLFENIKKNFIVNFFNKKIEEINNFIKNDDFSKVLNFSVKYQKIVNVLFTEMKKLKFENFKEIIDSHDIKLIHYIEIEGYSYKISESFLEMLNIIFHVYQILFLIINNTEKNNNNYLIFIFRQLSQIINNYITYCDNIIIEKENKKIFDSKNEKNSTENEIIILNSHINILTKILSKEFIKIDKTNTLKILDSLKVNHLQYNLDIKNSLNTILVRLIDNFDKLNFKKYPIKNNNNFNDYIDFFVKISEIYKQMLNAFNKDDVVLIAGGIFNKLFNLFEDSVNKKEKFIDVYMFTQFKNEMEFLENLFQNENNLSIENEIVVDGKKYIEKIKNFIEISKPSNNVNNNNKKDNEFLHSIKEVNEDDVKNVYIDDINLDDEINFRKMEKKTLAYKIGRNKHNHKKHKEIPVVEILDDDDNNNIPVFKRNDNSVSINNKSESSYGDTAIVNRNNNYVMYDFWE